MSTTIDWEEPIRRLERRLRMDVSGENPTARRQP